MPDHPASAPEAAGVASELALRHAFGQFATGVCIVAARPVGEQLTPFAITVNSFASVSLEPPLLLWCVQKDSSSYALWMQTRAFGVSVLNAQQGALCERFALRGNHAFRERGEYYWSAAGNPLIPEAVATFDCEVSAVHDAGDHKIIVARIVAFDTDPDRAPLIYLRGALHAQT